MKKKVVLRRILISVFFLWVMVSGVYVLIIAAPGDPSHYLVSEKFSPEIIKNTRESFGLDRPLIVQYASWLKNIILFDFGISFKIKKPVISIISPALLFTSLFAFLSLSLQLLIAVAGGALSYMLNSRLLNRILSNLSLILFSAPTFVLGLFLILIFSLWFDLFPVSGLKSFRYTERGFWAELPDMIHHMILPLLTLSAGGAALIYNYLRKSIENVKDSQFILYLHSIGKTKSELFFKHILPNAINPLISVLGVEAGVLLGGSLIVEVLFGLPGMGRLTYDAIGSRDYPLAAGCVLISGFLMITANLAADLIKGNIDKRLIKSQMN